MICCKQCGREKKTREFRINGQSGSYFTEVCRSCRTNEVIPVAPPSISKMAGVYTPPKWNIRAGSDQHLSIRSLG